MFRWRKRKTGETFPGLFPEFYKGDYRKFRACESDAQDQTLKQLALAWTFTSAINLSRSMACTSL